MSNDNGQQLAGKVAIVTGDLRGIGAAIAKRLASGENARATRLATVGPAGFLQKPFHREALEGKLAELLG